MEIDYNAIKSKVERERCIEHNQNAKFIKTRDGYSIITCCEKFEKKIAKKAETFLEKEIENLLNKNKKQF